MGIHKEGLPSILIILAVDAAIIASIHFLFPETPIVHYIAYGLAAVLLFLILQFFRKPKRVWEVNDRQIVAPADGKVVVIEEVVETEYFQDKRKQVSIFMSPINVHIQWAPVSGLVKLMKYHPGKYLVAWHPKSSTENERSTLVIEHGNGKELLVRQIAGALARRIVFYPKEGQQLVQGKEFGFIKFGSRVDLMLPLDAEIKVNLEQKVTGNRTVIAEW